MSYINTSTAVFVYINGTDVSNYLIEGSLSDDSAYTNNIITTTGQIVLGGSSAVLDFNRTLYPIGSEIKIYVRLDNGTVALHPKGTLYVINSTVNIEERRTILEVGCSLAFISDKEDSYSTAVANLYDEMLSEVSKRIYVVQEKDLSTLSNILEVEGSVIYQDQYGNIQKVSAFGDDGLGVSIRPPKFTSFDKYTAVSIESISDSAIESNVSAVVVEASIDVPTADSQNQQNGGFPNPLVTSVTERIVDSPWTYVGTIGLSEGGTANLTSESNPACGSINEPNVNSTGSGYSYRADGSIEVSTYSVREVLVNGKYTQFTGPGQQVLREESWEYCSAATWASSAITNTMNDYVNFANRLLSEANALLSKANQHFDARDKEPPRLGSDTNPKYVYHNCNAETFFAEAKRNIDEAKFWASSANRNGSGLPSIQALSNLTQTFNTYGKAGEVKKVITKNWQHAASLEYARQAKGTFIVGGSSIFTDTGIVERKSMPVGPINRPGDYNLVLASETIKTYKYDVNYTTEIEEYRDYIDTKRSYKKTSYSSSGSANAEQPDRLISKVSADGTEYCQPESEQEELVARVPILASSSSGGSGWFGQGTAYEKKVSFPAEFQPVAGIYIKSSDSCTVIDEQGVILLYQSIMRRYGTILAKKIAGDNRGFRITEKLRAELFEYYPFYPVAISTESIGRAFSARVASSNWVFDSENAICSFDCLVSADIPQPIFADPSTKVVYIKTETTKVLTNTNLSIGSTTESIKITTLPTEGSLFLGGQAVEIGDVIDKDDIVNNLLTFVPTGTGTSTIEFAFEQFDSLGDLLSSIDNVYPPVTTIRIEPSTYRADGGEFSLNVSTNGFDCDGGNLDTQVTLGGPAYMEAGDFDTGLAVVIPVPPLPPSVPVGNNSVNPEDDYGIYVKDNSENLIGTGSLATTDGSLASVFDIIVDLNVSPFILARLTTAIVANLGWDYGYFEVPFGTNIDMGLIDDPNSYDLDFGTFDDPNEPVLSSAVV